MKPASKNPARITLVLCLFLALGVVLACGIPFFSVPGAFDLPDDRLSGELSGTVTLTLSAPDMADRAVLAERVSRLGIPDVTYREETSALTVPRRLGARAKELASILSHVGVFTFTDVDGNELIPVSSITAAAGGHGNLGGEAKNYYVEFFLDPSARSAFTEATAALAKRAEEEKNLLIVRLDGEVILQATVEEAMVRDSFLIGGRFRDSLLPDSYAALFNASLLSNAASVSEPEDLAPACPLSAGLLCALLLLYSAFLGFLSAVRTLKFAPGAILSCLFTAALTLLFFQLTAFLFTPFTFIGLALGLIPGALTRLFAYRKTVLEQTNGRDLSAAFRAKKPAILRFDLIMHLCVLFAGALLWAFLPATLESCAAALFFANLISGIFSFWQIRFWMQISADESR